MVMIFSSLLSISLFLTTTALAISSEEIKKSSKIVCKESEVNEDTSIKNSLGEIIITLDPRGKASFVQILRPGADALPRINTTFSVKNSEIKHDILVTDKTTVHPSGAEKAETIFAKDKKGRTLTLKINDLSIPGDHKSSYYYEDGKLSFSNTEESTFLICQR